MSQLSVSSPTSTHGRPLYCGAGLSHDLYRDLSLMTSQSSHAPQASHSPHTPSTGSHEIKPYYVELPKQKHYRYVNIISLENIGGRLVHSVWNKDVSNSLDMI